MRRRRRAVRGLIAVAVVTGIGVGEVRLPEVGRSVSAAESVQSELPSAPVQGMLEQYCISCHNARSRVADLVLEDIDLTRIGQDAALWEKVLAKLHAQAMPPVGAPRPDSEHYESAIAWLEEGLDQAAAANPNPGRKASFHRLNRAEYGNVIRDLLALDIDSSELLPADDGSFGFDNIATALTVSSGHLERYMLAATKIARLAVGDPTLRPYVHTYEIQDFALLQEDRMSEAMPFGSRGGMAVDHFFPLDGEYVLRARLERQTNTGGAAELVRGLDEENEVHVYLDGEPVEVFRVPPRSAEQTEDSKSLSPVGNPHTVEEERDQHLNLRLTVKAGPHAVTVTFPKRTWYMENVGISRLPARSSSFAAGGSTGQNHGKIEIALDRIEIAGPFGGMVPSDTPSRRQLFVCQPSETMTEDRCAQLILRTLARRAYRRPVSASDVEQLLGFYHEGRANGSFDRGIQRALERVLSDPEFLFRIEIDPEDAKPGVPYDISDLQLASRLSFFLWSSIPDDELLDLAARGELAEPQVLRDQVKRMLADRRAHSLVGNFFGQWLHVRNMASHQPDGRLLPQFDESLRDAFQTETDVFLQTQLEEDRPVLEMLDADYTFVNERLARHYGIPDVYGSHYRRVLYPDDRRAGLLGHGSVLSVTSYPDRTSPVVRGKWVLENLLGAPPPPPPPNVPSLPEVGADGQPESMRGRLEQHRKNPVCAACHAPMDPLGFALENFDAVGRWREDDAGSRIDASGTLADGTAFDGPAAFRQSLVRQPRRILGTITEKLMIYALGRGLEYYDMPAVRRVIRVADEQGAHWSDLVGSIVMSQPFTMRVPSDTIARSEAKD